MSGTFNALLVEAGLDLADVLLIRHAKGVPGRLTVYELWHARRTEFELFQRVQSPKNQKIFGMPFWASFLSTPEGETLFAGLYEASLLGKVPVDLIDPVSGVHPGADRRDFAGPGTFDQYETSLTTFQSEQIGHMTIDWGGGFVAWKQRALGHDKPVLKTRKPD